MDLFLVRTRLLLVTVGVMAGVAALWLGTSRPAASQTPTTVGLLVVEYEGKQYPYEQFRTETHEGCPTGARNTTEPDVPLPQPHFHTVSGGAAIALDLTESADPDPVCAWGIIHTGFPQSASVATVTVECPLVAAWVRRTGMQAGTVLPQTVDSACGPAPAMSPAGSPSAADATGEDAGGGVSVTMILAPLAAVAIAGAGYVMYRVSHDGTKEKDPCAELALEEEIARAERNRLRGPWLEMDLNIAESWVVHTSEVEQAAAKRAGGRTTMTGQITDEDGNWGRERSRDTWKDPGRDGERGREADRAAQEAADARQRRDNIRREQSKQQADFEEADAEWQRVKALLDACRARGGTVTPVPPPVEDQQHRPDDDVDRDVEDPAYDPEHDEPEPVQPGAQEAQEQQQQEQEEEGTWRNPTGRPDAMRMLPFEAGSNLLDGETPPPPNLGDQLQRQFLDNPPDFGRPEFASPADPTTDVEPPEEVM